MNTHFDSSYFNVALATSLVLFGFDGNELKILIVPHDNEPFKGANILPSKYIKPDQSVESKVEEMVQELTQANYAFTEQLKAFTKVFRNPNGRVVNIAFYALVKIDENVLKCCEKNRAFWVDYNKIPDLAFDHNEIIEYAKERLKRRVKRRPIGFYLLPKFFTISQLQTLYETALNREMDKRNFRKKIFNSELIVETDLEDNSGRKVAKLYRFDEDKYEKMTLKGYDFLF